MNDEGACTAETPRARRNRCLDAKESPEIQTRASYKTVLITPLNHGFTVNVGCQVFAIEDPDKLTALINQYLKDPVEVETAWFRKDKNNKFYPDL